MLTGNLLPSVSMSSHRRVFALALVSFSLYTTGASGEESHTLVRADGAQVPVRVFGVAVNSCRGIAVISPGAGGTEKGLSYIAKALSRDGWLSVVVGHKESGPSALRGDMQGMDLKGGLMKLTTDRSAYEARWMDIGAALDWARPQCGKHFSVLIGHSMGAATVMLEAGARNVKSDGQGQVRCLCGDVAAGARLGLPQRCMEQDQQAGADADRNRR